MSKPLMVLLFIGLLSNYTSSAIIESNSSGGLWEDSTTWAGNNIPGENDDVIINGTVFMTKSNSCNNITISEGAIFQNRGDDLSWVILTVNGKITNNGTIRDNPEGYHLWLNIAGDIENNGIWTPEYTYLISEKVQNISQSDSVEFGGCFRKHSSDAFETSSFALIAQTDLFFNMSQFDGQGSKDGEYFWGILDMNNHNLTLKGKTEIIRSILKNVRKLIGQDSSSLQNISTENKIELDGCITITNSDVTFNGDVTITGILQNGGKDLSWVTPKFKAKLINNGIIRNNPDNYELWLDLYGDVVNNGIWEVARTGFVSLQPQTISQTDGKEFCGMISKSTTGGNQSDTFPLIAASDITINGENFNCNGSRDGDYFKGIIDMQSHNLTLKGKTVLFNAILENVDTLYCYDSAIVKTITCNGPVILGGEVTINDANVHFNDQVTVSGILQNDVNLSWVTLNINNNIINNGTIRNNPNGYRLWTAIKGNIENNGIWINEKNTLIGNNNQTITLFGENIIESQFIFDALWTNGPYQWKKDSQNLEINRRELTVDTITPDRFGTYQCMKEDSLSRLITVTKNGNSNIQIFSKNHDISSTTNLKWNITSNRYLYCNIQTPNNCSYSLDICNIIGKRIFKTGGILVRGQHTIPLIKTVSGTYILRFQSEDITNIRTIAVTR